MGSSYHICEKCLNNLTGLLDERRKSMPFWVPMIWSELKYHITDCYFCFVDIKSLNSKNKLKVQYPNLPSTIWPIAHSDESSLMIYLFQQTLSMKRLKTRVIQTKACNRMMNKISFTKKKCYHDFFPKKN